MALILILDLGRKMLERKAKGNGDELMRGIRELQIQN